MAKSLTKVQSLNRALSATHIEAARTLYGQILYAPIFELLQYKTKLPPFLLRNVRLDLSKRCFFSDLKIEQIWGGLTESIGSHPENKEALRQSKDVR
jgi:hypothetical protein